MNVSQDLKDMLNFATPFAPERLANSAKLIRSRTDFLRDLEVWCRDKIEQMHEISQNNPKEVSTFLSDTCKRFFSVKPQIGSAYEDIIETLSNIADTQSGGWFEFSVLGNKVYMRREPEILLLCLLKQDILTACCNSRMSGSDLTNTFCQIIDFPDKRKRMKAFGAQFYDFAKYREQRHYAPLWAQMEPIHVLEHALTVAFRYRFVDLSSKDPIYTANVDYRYFPLGTRTRKDEIGQCTTHPQAVIYTYDPFKDFMLPRNFRMFDNFGPVSEYGPNLEVYEGSSLICIKGVDVDIQNIALACETKRIAEYKAKVNTQSQTVEIFIGKSSEVYNYEGIPEEAYYDFLVDQFRIE